MQLLLSGRRWMLRRVHKTTDAFFPPLRKLLAAALLLGVTGCGEVWTDPLSSASQYDKGLIVMYPGALGSDSEMLGFFATFRLAGIDHAIEVPQWTPPVAYGVDPAATFAANQQSAIVEAERIAGYIRSHPSAPVTLFGFSAGSMYAMMVAAALPADAPVDRIILISSSVSRKYDVGPALDRSTGGALAYWSPLENTLRIWMALLGTTDQTRDDAAAYSGFDSTDPRLTQLAWTPDMLRYAQPGEHSAYLFNVGWILDFIVPHVPLTKQ